MSISSNIISGDFTSNYRDKYLQNFRNIEKLNYYIHDDFTLLDYNGNWSWDHWDGHQRFIEDVFISIDPLIDLDFNRTTDRSKAQIEIYKVSTDSPFADDGLLGEALGSHQVDNLNLIGFPKSKSFGFYRMAAWSMSPDSSPFLDDQNKYDLVRFNDAYTILHELGHTLGLSHPQSGGDDPSGSWHTSSDTVMSYNSIPKYNNWGYSFAPRWTSSDISALQTLWGIENDNKTYTITPSATSINEGSAVTISIATKNVASGTILYYTLSGNAITASDFSSIALSGSGLVGSNGAFSFTHILANDLTTEGSETLNIKLFSDSTCLQQVGSTASVAIADTSITPTPTYTLTPSASSINEGATLTTIVATTNVASGTTFHYVLSGSGITAADFTTGTLTGSGTIRTDGRLSISHTLANDLTTEGPETLNIKFFTDSARTVQAGSTASVSIADTSKKPTPTYIHTPSATSINEGSTLTTSVATTNVASGTTLYYSLSGTGITAADFSSGGLIGTGTLGSDGKFSIAHTAANDLTTEGAESLLIKLYSDSARTLQIGSTVTVNIVDTSVKSVIAIPPSLISVIATANGKETDGSPVVFSFNRTGDTNTALSVSYQLFGTAQAGSDYTGNTTGTVSFAAGSSSATLSLPALADGALIDPYETIIARINPATNYEIATGKQFATATITAEGMVVSPKGVRNPGRSSGEQKNLLAFAALKSDGSVFSWGESNWGGSAPAGLTGVIQIFSNAGAFAALKSDMSVVSWGSKDLDGGSMTAPAGLTGVIQIFSNGAVFAALKGDGSIVCWGNSSEGGIAPAGLTGVSQVFSTNRAFAALKSDGSVICWGDKEIGGVAPVGLTGVTNIFSSTIAFAALKSDGSVVSWGFDLDSGAMTAPSGLTGVSQISSTGDAFAALKNDGSVVTWGADWSGGNAPPGLTGVSQIFSNYDAFAALKNDGSVVSWGLNGTGGSITAPAGLTGVMQIFSTESAFAALKGDGSIVCWGDSSEGGIAPAGLTGVTQIFSNEGAFAALKSDGSVVSWGNTNTNGLPPLGRLTGVSQAAPAELTGVVGFANPYTDDRLVINDIGSSYSYYSSTINTALKNWNIYRVDNSIKAGDIVNQWFGTTTSTALQTQDPTDTKLLDITTSSWTEKVKINRIAKASDNGDVIEGKQKETGSTDIVGSVLTGGKGNDSIQAKAGWDMVDGGEGDDLVKTGNGRDILTGGTGRDELWGGFGWNTYKGDKDGFSDLIVIKSDQHLPNPTIGNKSGNNSDGLKTDIIENLDSIDKLIIQGVATNQITFASNATAQGLTGIGIYSKGFIEVLYTGGDLSVAQLTAMTTGDTSAAVMNNTLTSYGVW